MTKKFYKALCSTAKSSASFKNHTKTDTTDITAPHIPQRMCIACRCMKDKTSLIRIVRNKDIIAIDLTHKANGRGAYICKDGDCLSVVRKKRSLERAFKRQINSQLYDDLMQYDRY